jgi:hypothetical protein
VPQHTAIRLYGRRKSLVKSPFPRESDQFDGPLLGQEILVSLAKEVVDGPNPLFCPFA